MDVLIPHVLPQCFSGILLKKVCHTVEGNRDWVLLVILQDGSFDFQAAIGLSSINFSRAIARSHFPMSLYPCIHCSTP